MKYQENFELNTKEQEEDLFYLTTLEEENLIPVIIQNKKIYKYSIEIRDINEISRILN